MKKILFALMALLGIVACDTTEPSREYKLNLSVDKTEITADGKDVVTFIVEDWEGNVLEDATIHFADTHEALVGKTFMTKYPGEYEFYAQHGSAKSEVCQVYAIEAQEQDPTPEPGELILSVEPSTVYVDESVTFTVVFDDNDVTSEATIYLADGDVALDGNSYTATAEGVYSFYAKYEDITSEKVNVNVRMRIVEEEKPIELEATTTSIKANGVDYTKFTVTQNGANITDLSTIYVNGGVLNGSRFVTTTPGEYKVYAVKGEQKSNELTITAEEVTATGKSIVFADGVTLTSGWYDVNKKGQGDNGDINMCWAAASSNIIQWFQDRYVAAGKTLPSTAVSGVGTTSYHNYGPYELELMNMFHSEWDNSRGGHVHQAIPWYFEGELHGGETASAGSQAVPKTDGGYWKSIWTSEIYPNIYHGYDYIMVPGVIETLDTYATEYNNYYIWGNGTSLLGQERLVKFSELVVEAFNHGMASLTINLNANFTAASHAVTLWGYEIDNATGIVTRLWITDSDDLISEPKMQLLNEYSVSIDEGKSNVKLMGDTRYGACWVVSIHPVSGYGTAE